MESVDVVVVGTGFAGLGAAKNYLQCDPNAKMIVLEKLASVGGVWARERVYPDLVSNNQLGTLELPDFPMHSGYGVKPGEHIPGMAAYEYLADYASNFGIDRCIRFNSEAKSAEKLPQDQGWKLEVFTRSSPADQEGKTTVIITKKLIIATGLASQSQKVTYPGGEEFGATIFNSAELSTKGVEVVKQTSEDDKRITVLGGSKSAYDAVYMFASRGFQVNWVIRQSGYGPTYMAPSHVWIGPRQFRTEKLTGVRFLTWFCPNLWGGTDGHTWIWKFLHGTRIGRFLVDTFWWKLSSDVVDQSNIGKDSELKKLVPNESVMWYANSLAILNYSTPFHDYIKQGLVKIYRNDVDHLSQNTVHLSTGEALPSPAGLITATYWQWAPNVEFKPKSIHAELGIPSQSFTEEQKQFWHTLDEDADNVVFSKLPRLISTPEKGKELAKKEPQMEITKSATITPEANEEELGPFRLYRFMAPPGLTAKGDRSIVFTGFVANVLNQVRNEIAGLWCYAYLNNKIKIDQSDVCRHAAITSRFCKRRYPYGFGAKFPDFVFEQVPYFDQILEDLGLQSQRKPTWFKEIFEPYGPEDYRGVTEEWLKKQ